MRILINISHPAHVHLFRNFMGEMKKEGHEIKITNKKREMEDHLLEVYGFDYLNVGMNRRGIARKLFNLLSVEKKIIRIARDFKPDIMMGVASYYLSHVGKYLGIPTIIFDDTEDSPLEIAMYRPFASAICTPSCFQRDLGKHRKKQVLYEGYHELAYLHPNHFKPDASILNELSLTQGDPFVIIRFSSWDAAHDIRRSGFGSMEERIDFVKSLETFGQVFITSEVPLADSLQKYDLPIPLERIHDLLAFATMYVGGGATMASEAGVLGVPWIWISGGEMRGYLDDQENKYGLGYSVKTPEEALDKAKDIMDIPDRKEKWQVKRNKLLQEKIDVTKFMVWFIENFPDSQNMVKEDLGNLV